MSGLPTFQHVIRAKERIQPYVHRTPVLTSHQIDSVTGATLYFKSENLQRTGSFKARGGCNAVFSLSAEEASRGVATHSSGNHAQAIAYAAGLRGIQATIVMPDNAPPVKIAAVRGYGAEIVWAGNHPMDRERKLDEVLDRTDAAFIHPSNDPQVIAGQGTAALELIEDISNLNVVMVPVGGGGLLAGTALAVAGLAEGARTVGAEPETVDDAYRSLQDGRIHPPTNAETVADGLRTFLGDVNFPIIQQHVSEIVTVSEQGIVDAMRLIWERMKLVIEPSSSVPVAALLEGDFDPQGLRIGVILSGGNVDLAYLPWQL